MSALSRLTASFRRRFVPAPQNAADPQQTEIGRLIESDRAAWNLAKARAGNAGRVLIATNVTGFQHASLVEAVLAIALTLRGVKVELLACDGALPACLKVEPHSVPDPATITEGAIGTALCTACRAMGDGHFAPLELKQHRFSSYLSPADREAVRARLAGLDRSALMALTSDKGDAVGMQGLAGALRYYARAELPQDEQATAVLRRFVEAALLTTLVFERLLAQEGYDAAVFHHGIYVPQGPAGDVLRRHGIRVVNWNPSYRRSTFIFSHGNTYHYTLLDEPSEAWRDMAWSDSAEADILEYLNSRRSGTRDWIWFHEKPDEDAAEFARTLGLDPAKPVIGLLSNVAWDAQLHYPANAFPNMIDWVAKTIGYFARRPDLQLLIRVHPAEIRGTVPSQQRLVDEIAQRFPSLPPNVFVIAPESNISTYAAMALCDSVLIYGTKTGVELTAVGTPVIVAGEAWIRNKGLTYDARSEEDYFALLDRLPLREAMPAEQRRAARKYAYHFFFRRMLPLPFVVPMEGKIYGLDADSISALAPGRHRGLDVICNGILEGTPFVYEAERFGLHDQ